MSNDPVLSAIETRGIVPVVAVERIEHALPLVDALIAGGLPVIEVTFRTAAAAEVIRLVTRQRPQVLVGAGTVLTVQQVEAARQAGARFALAPGLNPAVVQHARSSGLSFVPGICTPSELEQAMELGCTTLKFFPAETAGGVRMLEAMAGPYGHTDVRFIPTGGISTENLASYLGQGLVAAAGGTWLARIDDLESGRWSEITRRCQAAVEIVRSSRS